MNFKQIDKIREDFPALAQSRHGLPPIYFDNACTTLVPRQVLQSILDYYEGFPGCGGGRSRHWFSHEVANRIEGNEEAGVTGSREIIQRFINARSKKEIIFTLNTSYAINMVALGLRFNEGDVVLLSDREHNSNLLPWLRLEKMGKIRVDSVPTPEDESFDLKALEARLSTGRVRLVSMAYTSNLTGATLPAHDIINLAHHYGAQVLLDAAQTIPHKKIDVQELDVDFLAFSIHKMCAGRGAQVYFYGKESLLGNKYHEIEEAENVILPAILGGGTVGDSLDHDYYLLDPPDRFETGIQNYPGQIAAGAALQYLEEIGIDNISNHISRLNSYLTAQLTRLYGNCGWFRILGPTDPLKRSGILTFEVKRPNAVGIADELDSRCNIMIRDGVYCVHSYFNRIYGQGWSQPRLPHEHRMTYRISLYFYNTLQECDTFLETLDEIFKERSYI